MSLAYTAKILFKCITCFLSTTTPFYVLNLPRALGKPLGALGWRGKPLMTTNHCQITASGPNPNSGDQEVIFG